MEKGGGAARTQGKKAPRFVRKNAETSSGLHGEVATSRESQPQFCCWKKTLLKGGGSASLSGGKTAIPGRKEPGRCLGGRASVFESAVGKPHFASNAAVEPKKARDGTDLSEAGEQWYGRRKRECYVSVLGGEHGG